MVDLQLVLLEQLQAAVGSICEPLSIPSSSSFVFADVPGVDRDAAAQAR